MWNVHFIGKPAAIKRALDEYASTLDGSPKDHFSEAKPALDRLLELNSPNNELSLSASNYRLGTIDSGISGVTILLAQSNARHVD